MIPPWAKAGAPHFVASTLAFALGCGLGWSAHRQPVAETKAGTVREAAKASSTTGEASAFRMTGEIAPKATVKWKRTPVAMPGAGCPVAYVEEGESTVSAESRIATEATKIAVADIEQEHTSDATSVSTRTPVTSAQPRLIAGAFVGSSEGRRLAAALFGVRLVGNLGVAAIVTGRPGGPLAGFVGATWTW